MTPPIHRFVVPSLPSNDLAGGKIAWGLLKEVAAWLHQLRQVDEIDFAQTPILRPHAIALIVALAKRLGGPSLRVVPPQDTAVRNHLLRLGVPESLGADWGQAGERPANVPIDILSNRPSPDFSYRVASLLAEGLPGGLPAGMTARIADSIDEVILNALAHAGSSIGCVVVGEAFPADQCIEVAIVDFGITIRGHLGRRFPSLVTDEQAIQEAVKEGVSGTPPGAVNRLGDPNSGVGLSELRQFVESTASELAVLSGSSLLRFGSRMTSETMEGQGFPGTLVNIRFNTNPGTPPPGPKGMI